jgi:hypothetical protein
MVNKVTFFESREQTQSADMCEMEEDILQLSMLILLYKTMLPAVLYCIGSPLVAVSFKVLELEALATSEAFWRAS